jgi:Endosomal/lysosomal potassium channel TMEM175
MLSFVIAGVFWISHHRRLARQPVAHRGVVLINLLFLLSIILLPVTTGLDGNYGESSAVAVLYGLHLSTIAGLNSWLWWLATRGQHPRPELVGAFAPLVMLLPGTAVAAVAPHSSGCSPLAHCWPTASCAKSPAKWASPIGRAPNRLASVECPVREGTARSDEFRKLHRD